MLEVRGVQARYGDAQALWGVDLDVAAGEMVCIVGPNGAGKTTLVKTIAGLHPAAAGSVRLDGVELTALPGHRVCDQAVATVPEGRRVFGHMTVRDNLLLGAYRRAARRVYRTTESEVYDLFPRLRERSEQHAGSLSGGEQQMLAIGRALMARPQLLAARRAVARPGAGDCRPGLRRPRRRRPATGIGVLAGRAGCRAGVGGL